MEFYTLPFDSAKSIFLGQLNPSLIQSYAIISESRRLKDDEVVKYNDLTRIKVREGTLDSVAMEALLSKASEEFNELFENVPAKIVKFFKFQAYKAIRSSDGGRNREYAFLVQYEVPKPCGD